MTKYKLLGINNDTETCDACGKTGLKRVMWLERLDSDGNGTGDIKAYGTTCGARTLGFKGEFSSVEQVASAVECQNAKQKAVEAAKRALVQFPDESEIAIIKTRSGVYSWVRGKAFDANPNRYGMPIKWISR